MMIGLGRAAYTNDPVGIQLSIVVREHGTHPSSRTEKGSIACRKSEAPREPDAFRDEEREPYYLWASEKGEAESISGHQTLQPPYGATVRCNTPRLPRVPRGRARRSQQRPGSGLPT